jgi:hypothetical protein
MIRIGSLVACVVIAFVPRSDAAVACCEELKVGVAVADITPPPGYRMSGYFSERLSTGMHDPLQAKAMVFNQGDEWAALVICDLVGVPREMSLRVRELASENTGIPASHMIIAATHTHTGPLYFGALRRHFRDLAAAKNGGEDPHEEIDYQGELVTKLVDVIGRAKNVLAPVKLESGMASERRLSFNRRFHMKDGSVRFNPGKLNADIVRPAGPIDPDVGLVMIRAAEDSKPIAALTVFALHLDTVGGTEYSADFPCYLERALQEELGGDFVSFFGAGTCGDINHIDVSHDRAQKGHEEAERIGLALAETVKAGLPKLKPLGKLSAAFRGEIIHAPLQKHSHDEIAQARKDMHKIGTRELPFLEQVKATKIVSIANLEATELPMEVQVLRLSEDLAVVGLPGEIFVELGLAIKQASPFKTTLVIELCNDAPGYVPTKKAFAEGSYETVNSRVQPGGGEMLVEAAVKLLKELKGD